MKLLRIASLAFISMIAFWACQKELSFEAGSAAVGTLLVGSNSTCQAATVNGIYIEDMALTDSNYVNVSVNITSPGTYTIKTDTLNGYYFADSGSINTLGNQVIKLKAHGTPRDQGTNTKTVTFGGTTCTFDVNIMPPGTSVGVYTLNCANPVVAGTYTVGTAATSANTVTLGVNVTTPGLYAIATAPVNGITFSGMGMFTATGTQTVVLTALGTPTAAGTNTFAVLGSTTCSFSITTTGGTGATSAFTFGANAGVCTPAVLAGTYRQGTAMTSGNTATLQANVTTAGTYNITSNAQNGVTFTSSGTFSGTGNQNVVFTASGTPAAAGTFTYNVSSGGASCSFTVTYTASGGGTTAYTFGTNAGVCTPATLAGTYTAGTAMTSGNTATLQANVTTAGAYNVSSNTQNGVTFSTNGTFSGTGNQNVVFTATGTPAAAGAFVYTVNSGTATCTFTVTYTAASTGADTLTALIDGVQYTATRFFRVRDTVMPAAGTFPSYSRLTFGGLSASNDTLYFDIEKDNMTATPPGTYNVNDYNTNGNWVIGLFFAVGQSQYGIVSDPAATITPDFSVVLQQNTVGGRIRGTFSGAFYLNADAATNPTNRKTLTNGFFSIRR